MNVTRPGPVLPPSLQGRGAGGLGERLGILLVSGVRHQAGYAPVYAAHPRLRVVALADEPGLPDWMDAANAALAERLGVPYLRDLDAALERSDVAIASVGSEPTRHARLAARAARAGKHVVVDKPMALTVAECDELEEAVRAGGGKITYIHRLFLPTTQRLRALIDSGRLGLPWAINVTWLAAGGLGGVTVERDDLVADPRLSGGGELANFLVYSVGTIRYLTGLEVESVFATTATHVHEPHRRFGVEDFGVLSLTLQRGVMATVTCGRIAAGAAASTALISLRVHGSHGSVAVDENRPRLEVYRGGAVQEIAAAGVVDSAVQAVVDDFIAAIDQDRPPLVGLADGRAFAAVLQAAYASARSGRVVSVGSAA